jgi:hypothetical protein
VAELLAIGLSAWIIQDGNYGDFQVGQRRAFALEFYAENELALLATEGNARYAHHGDTRYAVVGKVAHVASEWWVLDFGLPAYSSRGPTAPALGSWLRGDVYLGVDHFDYFERLSQEPEAPPLIFDWRVDRIEIQTAPLVEGPGRVYARDPKKLGWRGIAKTDAWNDDGGHAEYILHCERLSSEARRTLNAR